MSVGGEADLLRRAIDLCSRSAVATKAAYMQTLEQGTEQALLTRCTDRYALLERLIGLLMERRRAAPEEVRGLLDRVDPDPARFGGLEAALAEARTADARLGALLTDALAETALAAPIEACFEDALDSLRETCGGERLPVPVVAGAVLRSRAAVEPVG